MTTIAPTPSTSDAIPAGTGRVRFRDTSVPGFVEGGWWPRSLDLVVELPELVRAARASGRPVFRVMYSLTAWRRPPRSIVVDGSIVKLGGFRSVDPSIVTLVDPSGWQRLDVVVIPPDAEPAFAESALDLASADHNHRALEILGRRPNVDTEES